MSRRRRNGTADSARLVKADVGKYGATRGEDGSVTFPPEVFDRIRESRLRRAAVSSTPSTPQFLPREGGGQAIRKGSASELGYISFGMLRAVRERAWVLQQIHSARQYQIRRMSARWDGALGDVGWRVVHRDFTAHNAQVPKELDPLIKRVTRMLEKPGEAKNCNTMGAFLGPLWEDMATINRPVVEVMSSRYDPDRIVQWAPVDGALIWHTWAYLEKWATDNGIWHDIRSRQSEVSPKTYLEIVSDAINQDLTRAEFCLVRDGVVERTFEPGRLIVAPVKNRTDVRWAGYYPGHVEAAIEIATSFINATEFNAGLFTRGSFADYILYATGSMGGNLDAFRDNWREATQGVRRAHSPPILEMEEGDLKKLDLKGPPREMGFMEWHACLSAASCAIYRMDPSTINSRPWDGGSSSALSAPNREKEIALAKEEGLQGDLEHLRLEILNPIVQRIHPDLEVVLEYGDFDPQKAAQIYEERARTDMTVNEIRAEQGRRPLGFWLSDDDYLKASEEQKQKHDANPYNNIANPTLQQSLMMAQQQAQMAGGGGYEAQEEPDGNGDAWMPPVYDQDGEPPSAGGEE